ncbi:O-antigen ligase family protein [Pannonibacter phragmitetus]|uniref:O-antigen ligase family protein n=1 Tax=Pannonibacter phragmitetus TaxID=121719 RepID=UPI003D2F33A8
MELLLVAVFAALPPVLTFARISPPLFMAVAVVAAFGLGWAYSGQRMFKGLSKRLRSPLLWVSLFCLALMFLSVNWTPEAVQMRGLNSTTGALFCVVAAGILCISIDALPEVVLTRMVRRIGTALLFALPVTAILIFIQYNTAGAVNAAIGADSANYILNRSAVAIAIFIPFAALAAPQSKWLKCILLAGCAAATFQTESSSAQLGVLLITLLLVPALIWPRLTYRVVAAGMLLTFLFMPLIVGHVNSMIPQAIHDRVSYGSLTIRGLIWTEYANLLPNRLWFGYGMEASKVADKLPEVASYPPERVELLSLGHSHNAAVQLWFELGLAGAVLFAIAMALALLRIGRLKARDLTAATLTLAVIYGVSVVSHGAWQGWWLSLMVLAALPFMLKGRSSSSGRPS